MKFLAIITVATGIIPAALSDWAEGSVNPGNTFLSYCEDKDYPLMLDSLDFEPHAVSHGEDFTIIAKGKSNVTLSPGTLFEHLIWRNYRPEDRAVKTDLCNVTQCPTDTLDGSFTQTIPKSTQGGFWHTDIIIREPALDTEGKAKGKGKKGKGKKGKKGKGKKGRELVCVRGSMEVLMFPKHENKTKTKSAASQSAASLDLQ